MQEFQRHSLSHRAPDISVQGLQQLDVLLSSNIDMAGVISGLFPVVDRVHTSGDGALGANVVQRSAVVANGVTWQMLYPDGRTSRTFWGKP